MSISAVGVFALAVLAFVVAPIAISVVLQRNGRAAGWIRSHPHWIWAVFALCWVFLLIDHLVVAADRSTVWVVLHCVAIALGVVGFLLSRSERSRPASGSSLQTR